LEKNTDNVSDGELEKISARLFSLDVEGLYGQPDIDIQNEVSTLPTKDFAPRKYSYRVIPKLSLKIKHQSLIYI